MRKTTCCLLMFGLFASGLAYAEQGCPAGLVPTGQAPGPICVPMPGYGIGGPSPVQQRPSAPQPRWLDRWGAVAFDSVAAKMGTATDRKSSRDAERAALKDCKNRGGTEKQCKKTVVALSLWAAICLRRAVAAALRTRPPTP